MKWLLLCVVSFIKQIIQCHFNKSSASKCVYEMKLKQQQKQPKAPNKPGVTNTLELISLWHMQILPCSATWPVC